MRRQQEEDITTSVKIISRKKFLKWSGLGSVGLMTAVLLSDIVKAQPSTGDLTESPKSPASQPKPKSKTPDISEAELDSFKFEIVTVDQKGEIVERSKKKAKFFKEDLGNSVNLEMVSIPRGKFLMGTEDEEIEELVKKFSYGYFNREKPQHEVTVQQFFIGKYPITQAQYRQVMGNNPSYFEGDNRPVEQINWEEAEEFCQKLSKKTSKKYRLPSEAEWEYACRAGTKTPFYFGETITTELANYNVNYTYANEPKGEYRKNQTTTVGKFSPNAFGLYDMHGQVWEWCQDDWHKNYKDAPTDGRAWFAEDIWRKVMRGGSFYSIPWQCRSAYRFYNWPAALIYKGPVGFRVVCDAPRTK